MSKQRFTEIRITRTSAARHRSCAGGVIMGDFVDPQTGERVLLIKTVPVVRPPKAQARAGKKLQRGDPGAQPFLGEAPDGKE